MHHVYFDTIERDFKTIDIPVTYHEVPDHDFDIITQSKNGRLSYWKVVDQDKWTSEPISTYTYCNGLHVVVNKNSAYSDWRYMDLKKDVVILHERLNVIDQFLKDRKEFIENVLVNQKPSNDRTFNEWLDDIKVELEWIKNYV